MASSDIHRGVQLTFEAGFVFQGEPSRQGDWEVKGQPELHTKTLSQNTKQKTENLNCTSRYGRV